MAVREGWNVHNDIGMKMEYDARNIMGLRGPYSADNTIFHADSIEHSTFAEAMICLLRRKYNYQDNEAISEFVGSLSDILGKSVHDISPDRAQELLDRFEQLMDIK